MSLKPPKGPRDNDTPVEGVPIEPLNTIAHRTRATATDAKATLDVVSSLRMEIVESDKRSQIDHRVTNEKLGVLDDRVGALEGHVGNLRESAAANTATLALIREDTRAMKDAALHHQKVITETQAVQQKVTIETAALEQKALIEDTADVKKARREVYTKVAAILAAIGAAVTAYFAAR